MRVWIGVLLSVVGAAMTTPASRASAQFTWPGASGKSGASGARPSIDAFCSWRGRSCGVVQTYTDRTSWDSMTRGSGWLFDSFNGFPGQLVISQGLVPAGAGTDHPADMAACASGARDADFQAFGQLMVNKGRAASIVRLGWEFNGDFTPWSAYDTEQWKACYRHAANAVRAGDPSVVLDWTINSHGTAANVCGGVSTNCYPGDDVVDIVGIDNYDMAPSASSRDEFNRIADKADGLNWLYAFAVSHGKKFSVGEWGVAPRSVYNSTGENPWFIYLMSQWFNEHREHLAYEAYFNDCDAGVGSNLFLPGSSSCTENHKAAYMYRWFWHDPSLQ
jgi:hypothetical protein